jgi:hypothetical protein
MTIHMIASSTFIPIGDFGNSTSSFSEEWLSIKSKDDNSIYRLILCGENYSVSYQSAIKLKKVN